MKFTKTAVAVAIAGIAAVPMVASADTTLSGVVEININDTDATGSELSVGTGDVLFGITSEHELNSGLTGYSSLRLDLDALSNTGGPSNDAVYAGIKGGFGDIRIGEIPLAVEYGQVANDIFDVGAEINGGLSYTGTFGPAGIILNYSPEGNARAGETGDRMGIGAKFGIGGFSIGLGAEDRNELMNMSAGVSFAMAGASIAAHFWSMEGATGGGGDMESMSVKIGYGFGGVSAGLTVSTLQDDGATDQQAIRLDLGYGLGGGTTLSTRITQTTDNNASANDVLAYRLQLAKSF